MLCFVPIVIENNVQVEAAHPHIDEDKYDMFGCDAAGLSYQLRECSIVTSILRNLTD